MEFNKHFTYTEDKQIQRPCNPITEQERWGRVIENPEMEGYQLITKTPHFDVWAVPGTNIQQQDLHTGEAHINLMERLFEKTFDTKIQLFVYPNSELVEKATGKELLIRRDKMQLHIRVPARQLHEVVHLMTYRFFGHRSIPLFEEGIAEAYGNWKWRAGDPPEKLAIKEYTNEHVHISSSRCLSLGQLPKLHTVLTDKNFRSYRGPLEGMSYFFAASFSLFIIQTYSMKSFLNLLDMICNEDEANVIKNKIRLELGKDLSILESEWHQFLQQNKLKAKTK